MLLRLFGGSLTEGVNLAPSLEEARRQLHEEADYAAEARALTEYRDRLGDDPVLRVPEVHEDLTTPRLLAMDFAPGVPVDALANGGETRGERNRVAEALSRLALRELFELGLVQTDPNFANYLYDEHRGQIVLLDFGAVRRVSGPLVDAYRELARAAVAHDREGVTDAARSMGYLGPEDPPEHALGLADLVLMVSEPLRHPGPYDFGGSDLFGRVNAFGQELIFRRGFKRTPPPETMFLHRKFVGTFMLCTRLRANVDVHRLVSPWLERSGQG
jgi:predicted unusual protein kinase regulating ubiquinone biosynthesis (AarF/ABC1/UbiB family)